MSPEAHFSRRYRFSASHRLHVDTLSDGENQRTFGKCNNPHGHGHNYTLQVTVTGAVHDDTGMVVDMVNLDSLVKERVLDRFDVRNLNLDPLFSVQVSSTENLCREVWKLLSEPEDRLRFGTAKLACIRIEETSNNSFEYAGDEYAGKERSHV